MVRDLLDLTTVDYRNRYRNRDTDQKRDEEACRKRPNVFGTRSTRHSILHPDTAGKSSELCDAVGEHAALDHKHLDDDGYYEPRTETGRLGCILGLSVCGHGMFLPMGLRHGERGLRSITCPELC